MKWCARASNYYEPSNAEVNKRIMFDAIDVFCCSNPSPEDRRSLAMKIAGEFSINPNIADFYLNTRPSWAEPKANTKTFVIGRSTLTCNPLTITTHTYQTSSSFSYTAPTLRLLQRIAVCVESKEPVLLVGETGTGKTSSVQYLAEKTNRKLIVINMNQQSESADLLGGYKPVDIKVHVAPVMKEFTHRLEKSFNKKKNEVFMKIIAERYEKGKWKNLLAAMRNVTQKALQKIKEEGDNKQRRDWEGLEAKLDKLEVRVKASKTLAFSFIEGSLVKALKEGYWVLLDEINLANAETLECLSGLLDGATGSLTLLERGDEDSVKRHPDFKIFACMNPANDAGKKELPMGLRNRFTELFVDELENEADLRILVSKYLEKHNLSPVKIKTIVEFYVKMRVKAKQSLSDGIGQKPHFSLRTLCRALRVSAANLCGGIGRSLYEGFCLSFLTQLDGKSYGVVEEDIRKAIFDKAEKGCLGMKIPKPSVKGLRFVECEGK